jgi:hypothetical protein
MKYDDKVSLGRITVITALVGAITLMLGIVIARAEKQPQICDEKYGCHPCTSEEECKVARAEEEARPVRFRPWQQAWQCNDIRVTVSSPKRDVVVYDLGGTIWGGSQFTMAPTGPWGLPELYFNGRPCVPLR